MEKLLDEARVDADVEIIVSEKPFQEVLHATSNTASVVMLGFNVPETDEAEMFQENYESLLTGMPTTLLVCSSGEADLFA